MKHLNAFLIILRDSQFFRQVFRTRQNQGQLIEGKTDGLCRAVQTAQTKLGTQRCSGFAVTDRSRRHAIHKRRRRRRSKNVIWEACTVFFWMMKMLVYVVRNSSCRRETGNWLHLLFCGVWKGRRIGIAFCMTFVRQRMVVRKVV